MTCQKSEEDTKIQSTMYSSCFISQ